MKPKNELRRLTRQQVPEAEALIGRAFYHDPLSVFVFPDETERTHRVSLLYSIPLRYALHYGEVTTTPAFTGVACWLPPEQAAVNDMHMLRVGAVLILLKMGRAGLRRSVYVENAMRSLHQNVLAKPHWYLWVLGVDPVHQRQGIGGILLRAGLARADASSLPCYLETTNPENVLLYQKFGFLLQGEKRIPDSNLCIWSMVRPVHGYV